MNNYEYPSESQLKRISDWDILEKPVRELLDYIESIWWTPDWGFCLKGKRVLRLELHTGGWSGNESIIDALQKNWEFWMMYWMKTYRGGHYYFRIDLRQIKPKEV